MLTWIYGRYSFWGLACYACGGNSGWKISFRGWRSQSCVAAASCRRCGAKQFLKKYYRPGSDKTRMAQREYEVLQSLHGTVGAQSPLLAPRVYNFSATHCALSMEYLHGQSMAERMRLAQDRQSFHDCLRASATWLRSLHAVSDISAKAGNDYATLLQRLEDRCGPLANRNEMAYRALTLMRSSLAEIVRIPMQPVLLHCDFKPSNLIWTAKGVYCVDLGLQFRNSAGMDAAQFIVDVLLNRRNIPAIARDQDATHILDVFLGAYGDNREHSRRLTAWWILYFLLSQWQSDLKGWRPSILVERNYAALLDGVMSALGGTSSLTNA